MTRILQSLRMRALVFVANYGKDARSFTEVSRLSRHSSLLDHQAAVQDDLDAGFGEFLRGLVVADPELELDELGLRGVDVVDVRRDVGGAAEDVDHVDGTPDVGQLAVDLLAQNLRDLGVVNGYGDDLVAGRGHVRCDVVSGLIRVRFRLDAEHSDAP